MSCRRFLLAGALLLYVVVPAGAQSVKVAFHDGRVNVSADNVPLTTILAEWSRVGGTKIVNGDRVGGLPLTLELNNVPERTALEVILRSVAGYMVGPRASAARELSIFQSILIVPTSTPAPAPASVRPVGVASFPQPVPVPQINQNDPEENPPTDVAPGQAGPRGPNGPGVRIRRFQQPQNGGIVAGPAQPRNGAIVTGPGVTPAVIGPNGQPVQVQPDPDDEPGLEQPQDATPANPFGGSVSGSSRPGEITPVPQQPQRPPRPNGDPEP